MTTPGMILAASVALLQETCHLASKKAGWWLLLDGSDLTEILKNTRRDFFTCALVAQKLALIHSEISEALEGHRKDLPDAHLPHRSSIEVELADAVIRIADLAGALGLDLGGALVEKMSYNLQRADHQPENRNMAGGKSY